MTHYNSGTSFDGDEGIPHQANWFCSQSLKNLFSSNIVDPRPFWSVMETLAWVTSGSYAFVEHVRRIEKWEPSFFWGADAKEVHPKAAIGQVLLITSKNFCKCNSQDRSDDVDKDGVYGGPLSFWRDCQCLGNASSKLFDAIRSGRISPIDSKNKTRMTIESFTSLDLRNNGTDWLTIEPSTVFDSYQVIKTFPHNDLASDESLYLATPLMTKMTSELGLTPDPLIGPNEHESVTDDKSKTNEGNLPIDEQFRIAYEYLSEKVEIYTDCGEWITRDKMENDLLVKGVKTTQSRTAWRDFPQRPSEFRGPGKRPKHIPQK